ncbi:MAG: YggU family protein [Methanobacteriaceae archaeon]|nr:YggU family protein [Methanobacteriaceae archaeon]
MQAVKEIEEGVLVDIEVSPNSDKFSISGYNEWRDEIQLRIKSIPQKGKANKEIIKEFTKLTNSKVEIVSGLKSQHKTLKIYDLSKQEFLNILVKKYPNFRDKKD